MKLAGNTLPELILSLIIAAILLLAGQEAISFSIRWLKAEESREAQLERQVMSSLRVSGLMLDADPSYQEPGLIQLESEGGTGYLELIDSSHVIIMLKDRIDTIHFPLSAGDELQIWIESTIDGAP